jgi:NADH-quinone oxidoreductase subunit L
MAPFSKSAHLPLSPWLTDAMAAPTPVSALLHAATMVTAGIFLLLRIATVLQWHLTIVGIFAGFTLVFGGTLAVLAPDIKQIIAYSTTSQLG